jgi:hypothetical protein
MLHRLARWRNRSPQRTGDYWRNGPGGSFSPSGPIRGSIPCARYAAAWKRS